MNPDEAQRLLERVEGLVPHLVFDQWHATRSADDTASGDATWQGENRRAIKVTITGQGRNVVATCRRDTGTIQPKDHRLLGAVAREAFPYLRAIRERTFSLVNFGVGAVADEIEARLGLEISPLPILQFIRGLSQETYENQRLSYGLIIAPGESGQASIAEAFDNKRFKRLTDGFSTALVVDGQGRIVELAALTVPRDEGLGRQRRPWWAAAIAEAAAERGGVGIALTRNGDLLVVHERRLVFTQRAGRWWEWDHGAILARLRSLWQVTGNPQQLGHVLSHLYHLAMDLSFRRSGGLLVVTESRTRVRQLLASPVDLLGSERREEPERALDRHFEHRLCHRIDRRVISDLASLDGALVVDRTGRLWAYGAMTKASRSAQQGARSRAARAASQEGVAIKVSSDGSISFFRKGQCRLEI